MDYTILSAGFDKKQVFDGVFFYPFGAWLQRRESNDISLSLVTCRGNTGKGGLNGLENILTVTVKIILKCVSVICRAAFYGVKLFLLLFVLVSRIFLILAKAAIPQ